MTLAEASFNSTLRTILVLLVLWWLLRMFMRAQRARSAGPKAGPARPKGDVRIENAPPKGPSRGDHGIIDAEYEEIH